MNYQKENEKYFIGCDETGVGDYFTPLVSSCVWISETKYDQIKALGVKDSKQLTTTNIQKIFKNLHGNVIYSSFILPQWEYNKLNTKYNANELKYYIHLKNIQQIIEKNENLKINKIIIDQFSNLNSLKKYFDKITNNEKDLNFLKSWEAKIAFIEKAESLYLTVASSSIIGRNALINWMNKQNLKWKTTFPLGTNKQVMAFAKKFVQENGPESLNQVAKIHFKTTKEII